LQQAGGQTYDARSVHINQLRRSPVWSGTRQHLVWLNGLLALSTSDRLTEFPASPLLMLTILAFNSNTN
jgi:hypothetical protein